MQPNLPGMTAIVYWIAHNTESPEREEKIASDRKPRTYHLKATHKEHPPNNPEKGVNKTRPLLVNARPTGETVQRTSPILAIPPRACGREPRLIPNR